MKKSEIRLKMIQLVEGLNAAFQEELLDEIAVKERTQELYEKSILLVHAEEEVNVVENPDVSDQNQQDQQDQLVVEETLSQPNEEMEKNVGLSEFPVEEKDEEHSIAETASIDEMLVDSEEEKQEEKELDAETEEFIVAEEASSETIHEEPQMVEAPTLQISEEQVSIGEKIMNKGISDLSQSIGISEKFMFIHELFDGNTERYIKELDKLNSAKDAKQALERLEKLKTDLNWGEENEAAEQLQNLVERKYV